MIIAGIPSGPAPKVPLISSPATVPSKAIAAACPCSSMRTVKPKASPSTETSDISPVRLCPAALIVQLPV
ncbi:MAG: hypothetical protein F4037_01805 [Gemmatimonadales bacterium]|nr:hypothetical protein [Candidatus Palauibacter ramosifaciens]